MLRDVLVDRIMPAEANQQALWALNELARIGMLHTHTRTHTRTHARAHTRTRTPEPAPPPAHLRSCTHAPRSPRSPAPSDENISRMKEAKMKLLLNELKVKTVRHFAEERDKRGRRGREARVSAAMLAHTATFLPADAVDNDDVVNNEPVLYVPRRLRKIDWDAVTVFHVGTRAPLEVTALDKRVKRALPGTQEVRCVVWHRVVGRCWATALPSVVCPACVVGVGLLATPSVRACCPVSFRG